MVELKKPSDFELNRETILPAYLDQAISVKLQSMFEKLRQSIFFKFC